MGTMRLTIRQLFFILLFLGLFLMTLRPVSDPDFWWHLRTGQLIIQTHSIPHSDPFSYNNTGKPWVAHEWLSEVIIYGLFSSGGYGLLIFLFALVITGTFLLAYMQCPRESRPYMAGFSVLLGAISTAPTWGVRPQMISLLMTSLFLFLLDRFRAQRKIKFLIPLPFLILGWVNLHAGYILGFAIMGIYIVGGLFDMPRIKRLKTAGLVGLVFRPTLLLCSVLGASILATFVNPNGLRILIYPFQTLTSPAMQLLIQEWFSPDFHQLDWQPLAWLFLALIGVGMLGTKRFSTIHILLTIFFGYAALRSMRNVPLFVVVAIPILAEQVNSFSRIRSEPMATSRLLKWIVPLLLVSSILAVSFRFMQVVQEQPKSETENFPAGAVDWIRDNQPEGNLFNSYGWGGYIIWRIYPQYPVYIDGRADVYGDEFLYSYMDVYRARPGWEQVLSSYNVNLVLVEPDSALASALQESSGWEIVYEDYISILFDKK